MADIYLNTTTHDIDFDGLDLRLTEDTESIAQRIKIRLLTYKGEWFLNTEFGTPYFQTIFQKPYNAELVDSEIRKIITSTPGVVSIKKYSSSFDNTNRSLTVNFTVLADTGLEAEIEVTV